MKPVELFGWDMKRLAFLENAHKIGYHKFTTKVWTATFSLPYHDKKRDFIEPFMFVKIWDVDSLGNDKSVGMFRILPMVETDILSANAIVTYECEHVISTLLDDVMIGFHEIGNRGVYTPQVIRYILEHQSNTRWVLGECYFLRQFLYGWENENLLSALFSVPKPFEEDMYSDYRGYYWIYDTDVYPWRLTLDYALNEVVTDVRYRKNLIGMSRTVDPRNLTTRLYCYGAGEGDNILNFKKINYGKDYLDSPNIKKYGVISQIWRDERFTNQESLLAAGKAMLKKLETPAISYEFDIKTVYNTADLDIGNMIRVVALKDLDQRMIVQEIEKSDVSGKPMEGTILVGQNTETISESVAGLIERQRISESYAQGAESLFMDSVADNADKENPVEINFIIPSNAVHVNEILLNVRLESFRVHVKSVSAEESKQETSSSKEMTTESTTTSKEEMVSSTASGIQTTTSASSGGSTYTSSAGGSIYTTSKSGGSGTTGSFQTGGGSSYIATGPPQSGGNPVIYTGGATWGSDTHGILSSPVMSADGHKHALKVHNHTMYHFHNTGLPPHWHSIKDHEHDISIGSHKHDVSVASHTHSVSLASHDHKITLKEHKHDVKIPEHSHQFTIPKHDHKLEYGIYKGPRASTFTIHVDDKLVTDAKGSNFSSLSNLNLIPFLKKEDGANGQVLRGNHKIKITPSGLTRIEAWFQIRLFTQSRGSGQY